MIDLIIKKNRVCCPRYMAGEKVMRDPGVDECTKCELYAGHDDDILKCGYERKKNPFSRAVSTEL